MKPLEQIVNHSTLHRKSRFTDAILNRLIKADSGRVINASAIVGGLLGYPLIRRSRRRLPLAHLLSVRTATIMAAELPLWRRAFDTIEAGVGRPLEQAVGDPRFMRALIVDSRSRTRSTAWRERLVPGLTSRHIPPPDVRRISRRLGAIENRLVELAEAIARLAAGTSRARPRPKVETKQSDTLRSHPRGDRADRPPGARLKLLRRRPLRPHGRDGEGCRLEIGQGRLWRTGAANDASGAERSHPGVHRARQPQLRSRSSSGKHFVRTLAAGHDVYLLDWGSPRGRRGTLDCDLRARDLASRAPECSRLGSDDLTILAIVWGDADAHRVGSESASIRDLVTMATPATSRRWATSSADTRGRLNPETAVDARTATCRRHWYARLERPATDRRHRQYANLWQHLWNDQYMEGFQAMSEWIAVNVPLPGAAFREIVRE